MDYKKMCRTCLYSGTDSELMPLFGESSAVEYFAPASVVELLDLYTDVKITKNDGFPDKICIKCLDQIKRSFEFKKNCKKTEEILQQLEQIKGKKKRYSNLIWTVKRLRGLSTIDELTDPNPRDINLDLLDYVLEFATEKGGNSASSIERDNRRSRYDSNSGEIDSSSESELSEQDANNCTTIQVFQCPACPDEFQTSKSMRKHMMEKHIEGKICLICDKEYESNIWKHTKNHIPKSYCSCGCDKLFIWQKHLENHIKERKLPKSGVLSQNKQGVNKPLNLNEKPFKCNICDREFRRKDFLTNHLITHSEECRHECTICSKKYKRKDNLRQHIKKYHSENFIASKNTPLPIPCEHCLKIFPDKKTLKTHLWEHTGKPEFKCETCSKIFEKKLNLIQHQNVHSTEKPFKCEKCKKCFTWKRCLTTHMLSVHSKERQFKCEICPASFKQKTHLNKHTQQVHKKKIISENSSDYSGDEQALVCKHCPSSFKNQTQLTKHKKKYHAKRSKKSLIPVED